MFDQIKDASLKAVSALLAVFYDLPVVGGSYGLSIILLTLTIMVVLMPLTLKATRSTIKMTQIQPQMRALQKKHKDDRQKLNEEMMALYQREGVNPVGGCLPMVAQLPVFLLLFNVLRGLSRRVSDLPYYTISQRAHELAWGGPLPGADRGQFFEPANLDHNSQMYKDLTTHTEIGFLPGNIFDLSARSWDVLQGSVVKGIPYLLLIAFVVGTSYYQQRQISARRGAVPDNPTPQQQTQQQLLKVLPLMSGIWSFLFPAGLVLYWATSNSFRIAQQAYITRSLYSEEGEGTRAMAAMAAAKDDDDDDDGKDASVQSDDDIVSDGRPGRSKKARSGDDRAKKGAAARNGAGPSGARGGSGKEGTSANGSTPADRNEAWARRRAERAKTKTTRKASGSSGSGSRVTPKGTKPTDARKKRKR
jgi:YidC/Oxa1 family membrane protein insertase